MRPWFPPQRSGCESLPLTLCLLPTQGSLFLPLTWAIQLWGEPPTHFSIAAATELVFQGDSEDLLVLYVSAQKEFSEGQSDRQEVIY